MNIKYLTALGCLTLLVNPVALAVNQPLQATAPALAGKYFGKYNLTMNTATLFDPSVVTELNGVQYSVLGKSTTPSYWQWDFDNNEVIFGSGIVFAMKTAFVPFQAFNQSVMEAKRADETYIVNDITEITAPFIDHGDGTYTVEYSQKMYFHVVGFPIGNASTTFKVAIDGDQLSILTIDQEAADVELNGEGGKDGIPGSRIANVFPFVIQPQWDSIIMLKDDGTDSNNDGVSDTVATILGANPQSADSDQDGIPDFEEIGTIFVNPTDNDGDNVPDINDAKDPSDTLAYQTIVKLVSQETLRLTAPEGETIYTASAEEIDTTWGLEQHIDNFTDADFSMGVLSYQVTNYATEHQKYNAAKDKYFSALTKVSNDNSVENQENLALVMPEFAAFADVIYIEVGDWRDIRINNFADIDMFNDLFKGEVPAFNDNIILTIEFPNEIPEGLVLTRRYVPFNPNELTTYNTVTWQESAHKTIELLIDTKNKSYDTADLISFDDVQLIFAKDKAVIVTPPPVLTPTDNIPPTVSIANVNDINEGEKVSITATATDSENSALTYSRLQKAGPSVAFNANDAEISFDSPNVTEDQILTFEVTVSDGELSATSSVSFNVLRVNTAPSVSIKSENNNSESQRINLSAIATDMEQDTLIYSWTQTQGSTVVFDKNNANISFSTPELLNDETFSFSVEVSDGALSKIATIDIALAANATEKTVTTPIADPVAEVPVTATPVEQVKESKKSGGSVNWLMIALLGLVAFGRKSVHLFKRNR